MAVELSPGPAGGRRRSCGFSLIEVLIAAALLLVIAIGIVPIFARALISNTSGNESTQVSNHARSRLEQFYQLPFNGADLTIDTGTEKTFTQYYSRNSKDWVDGEAPTDGSDVGEWSRVTTVRQYGIGALSDNLLEPSEALDASTAPAFVHLKEIEVTLAGLREGGAFGPAKQITLRVLKFK